MSHSSTNATEPTTDISMQFSHANYFQWNQNAVQHIPARLPSIR